MLRAFLLMKVQFILHFYIAIFLDRIVKMIYFSVLAVNLQLFFKKIEYFFLSTTLSLLEM
jgi:hypothetical protein